MTETRETESILEAVALIDRGLGDISERNLVPSTEVADLLQHDPDARAPPAISPPRVDPEHVHVTGVPGAVALEDLGHGRLAGADVAGHRDEVFFQLRFLDRFGACHVGYAAQSRTTLPLMPVHITSKPF